MGLCYTLKVTVFRDMRKLHLPGSEELCLVILNWMSSDLAIASVVFDGLRSESQLAWD